MSASGYAVWKPLFPNEETLDTEIRPKPFRLLEVVSDGIKLRVPVTNENDRTLILRYPNLDALWEGRDAVKQRIRRNGSGPVRQPFTTAVNQVWQDAKKNHPDLKLDHRNEAQYWALVCARERLEQNRQTTSLTDEEAIDAEFKEGPSYSPQEGDWRRVVDRQIRERRGQRRFRDALRERHGDRCMVTACPVLAVLEAAHINPYRGDNDNHPDNGLLLRADIHTLFDLNLLGIDPGRLQVELHPSLSGEYGHIAGTKLGYTTSHAPSQEALSARYEEFQRKLSGNT